MKHPTLVLILILVGSAFSKDRRDSVVYETRPNFYGNERAIMSMDFSDIDHVRNLDAYNPVYHTKPIRQDTTGTCWCFSMSSFLESELYRLGTGEIELSRMYIVYWEYVEKVRRWVRERGNSLVAQGSQFNAVLERMKQYGAVPAKAYTGLLPGETIFDHNEMEDEILTYLDYVEEQKLWNEDQVLANVKMILNRTMGRPPQTILVDGTEMTPQEYLQDVIELPIDDYVAFISFKNVPFWTMAEYDVPDNWWHANSYHNVPLPEFYDGIKTAIKNGYSVAIAGDVSEPGKYGWKDIAVVPSFDIPSCFINQDSREFRFYNETSTDDHGVHLIGYTEHKGEDWFLIKDSAASAWRGSFDGYHFFHGDYIKLKILAFVAHKDAVKPLLEKFSE